MPRRRTEPAAGGAGVSMNERRWLRIAAAVWVVASGVHVTQARGPQQPLPAPSAPASDSRALVDKYCVTCHNQRARTGGLALDTADIGNLPAHPDLWEKVIRKVRTGMMPPAGAPR